jgi:hypothetical protein
MIFKVIAFLVAAIPIFLFVRSIFFRRTTRVNEGLREFKKQANLAVSIFLLLIACVVVFAAGEQLGIDPDCPDSFAFVATGQGYVKSEAALRIARELPRWQWAWVFHFIPRVIRDAIYDLVARNRYRWFGNKLLHSQLVNS